ncbi:MAG: lysylphosphatidylglycerol synthase domain-containing protein, partial [Verrucomicrobiota bacterium]
MKSRAQVIGRIIVSAAVSFSVLALIFSLISGDSGELSRTRILYAIWSVPLAAAGLYFVCQLLQAFFRAARYRVLLKGGGEKEVPAMPHLFLVSMTRNMSIDLLPARIGELSYVAMLNRGYRVSGEACVSSLGVSVLFDFLALWAVIVGVVLTPLMGKAGRGSLIGAGVLLTLLVAIGWAVLFRGVPAFSRWLGRMFGGAEEGSLTRRLVNFLDHVARSFKQVRESGVLLTTLALSAAVRVSKYLGLYILFVGVTRASWPAMASAPAWAVLAALIAAEGSASLPVPAFMSFGTYEAGGLVALTALGFSAEDSATAMMAMHIFSQAIDYTLGGLALVAFTLVAGRTGAAAAAGRAASARHSLAALAVAVLLSGSLLFFALQLRQLGKMGALAPPASGSPAAHGADEDQKLRKAVQNLRGFIVWSSNRHGNHDILRLSLPDLKLTRLTKHPNLEYYPRISPDGTRIVFSRCQLAWGSLRDPVPWDVYLLDLRTGRESLVARGGNTPVWSEDGTRVYFQRARGKFVEHELASGRERVLFESGVGKVPPDVQLQTPDFNTAL